MKKLFTTALVIGSVGMLGACHTTGTSNDQLPVPYSMERTAGAPVTKTYKVKAKSKKQVSRMERTYTAAQSK